MLLTTGRLTVRDLAADDLDAVHRILDVETGMDALSRAERAEWLQWTVLDYAQRRRIHQPPYGEYAVAARDGGEVVGIVGLVPSMMPFGLLPSYGVPHGYNLPEVGMFWATSTAHQRRGYAAEAGGALMDFGFAQLKVRRIVATTEHDNTASIAVMRRIGMRVERRPGDAPFFLDVVGWTDSPYGEPEWPASP